MTDFITSVSLGLIQVPGRVRKATDEVKSNATVCIGQVDKVGAPDEHDPERIREPKTCSKCGVIDDPKTLRKAVEKADGTYSILSQEEIDAVKDETSALFKKRVDLVAHAAEDVLAGTQQGEGLKYLFPEPKSDPSRFGLIVKIIADHPELAFVAMHTPRSKAAFYHVRVHGNILMMEERIIADHVMREAPEVDYTINETLLAQMESFLPSLVTQFNADDYVDGYADKLKEIAEARAGETIEGEVKVAAQAPPSVSDDDLIAQMAALRAATKPARKPAKKATAKKAATAA